MMETDCDVQPETLDLKLASSSPSTHSEISTDGDASITQSTTLGTDKRPSSTDVISEPKTKKRRKQSKPLKCESLTNTMDELELTKIDDQEIEQTPSSETVMESSAAKDFTSNKATEEMETSESMSQKNILSQMTDMLYGSMNRSNNNNNNISGQKNKSSLHLLAEMTSPDSSEESSRLAENNNRTVFSGFYPQMPPLLPLNPSEFAGELSKLSSVFSQMAEMPTQLMQTNLSMATSSNRSFITSNGVRVFNPEAYCELCEKEFCNKYFLKTHKANKHGVCSVDTASFPYRMPFKTSFSIPQPTLPMAIENGSNNSPDAYCNICQKSFCNKYFLKKHRQNIHGIAENGSEPTLMVPNSIHVPVISSLHGTSSDTKSEENSLEQALSSLKNKINGNSLLMNGFNLSTGKNKSLLSNKNGKETKNDRFVCELCNIEFRDMHYLNIHKQNKHGAGSPKNSREFPDFSEIGKMENIDKLNKVSETWDEFKVQTCIPCMTNFTSSESFQSHMLDVHGAAVKEKSKSGSIKDQPMPLVKKQSSTPESEGSDSSSDSSQFFCSICLMKFKEKSSLLAHYETNHNLNNYLAYANGSSDVKELQCDACTEQFSEKHILMAHRLKIHGIISPMPAPSLNDVSKGMELNFSHLVNVKQHGNSVQTFCHICNKELNNKYVMKNHMLKVHGVDVDTLQNDGISKSEKNVTCDICHKQLSSKLFLKVHKRDLHGISEDVKSDDSSGMEDTYGKKSNDLHSSSSLISNEVSEGFGGQLNSAKLEEKNYSCEICGEEFSNKLLFQVHLVNKHVNNTESNFTNLCGLLGIDTLIRENGFDKTSSKSPKSCSCCTIVPASDGKMYLCHICSISYHHNDHYQHHLTHRNLMMNEMKGSFKTSESKMSDSEKHLTDSSDRSRLKPRKFKRFRCSKCDKTFRTKNKCLHHIQVVHKSKKLLPLNHVVRGSVNIDTSLKKVSPAYDEKVSPNAIDSTMIVTAPNSLLSEVVDKKTDGFVPSPQLPVPYVLPKSSAKDIIMQPFHLTEPKLDGMTKPDVFVPSVVYLPVNKKVLETVTVAFTLTPA